MSEQPIEGWCDEAVENRGPLGSRPCGRLAKHRLAGRKFCTFHANRRGLELVQKALQQAADAVRPVIEAEREAEKIGQGLMEFRMGDT